MPTFAQRLARRLRHWRMNPEHARRDFPQATLDAITAAIAAGEAQHRAQLRLIVETALPGDVIWQGHSIRQRALHLFAQHGIWDTEDNCGVLLYLNLAERRVEIVADRAVNRHVSQHDWQQVCHMLTQGFRQGQFHQATLDAVAQINELLRTHFPREGAAHDNELPDRPLLI